MPQLLPDQTFYPSPTMAMTAPPETIGLRGAAQPGPRMRTTPWPWSTSTRTPAHTGP